MILNSKVVEQAIDIDERGYFVKDLIVARGPQPIALVRKRAARVPEGGFQRGEPGSFAQPTLAPVLLIHGYGQNRYAFHLPSRSLVNHLARAGFDVFNLDLRGRGRSSHLGAKHCTAVTEFIEEDVPTALEEIAQHTGGRPVFLVGHSLGGIVAYCVAVRDRPRVAGVVSLGSPYLFALGSRWLAAVGAAFLAVDSWKQLPNLVVPARAYGRYVRAARKIVESPLYPVPFRGFRPGEIEPEVLEEHMALAMDRGSIATMRSMFAWARDVRSKKAGEGGLFGYGARFEALDIPLLVVAGRYDDLAPAASVRPAYERSHSTDRSYRELPFGHVDMLIGREAPQLTWPLLESWLKKRVRVSESLNRSPSAS